MTPFDTPPSPEESALLEGKPPRGHPLVAWLVIVAVTSAVVIWQEGRPRAEAKEPAKPAKAEGIDVLELQGRVRVGAGEMAGPGERPKLAGEAKVLNTGSVRQRLRAAIVQGELAGAEEALGVLEGLLQDESMKEATAEEQRAARLLQRLYRAYKAAKEPDPDVLPAADQEFLRKQLGWFGELALVPRNGPDAEARKEVLAPALQLVTGLVAGAAGGCGAIVLGLILLVVLLVVLGSGPQRRGFKPGSPYGGLYVETFALWMVLFVGVQFAGVFAPKDSRLFVVSLLNLSTLLVLAWPVMRGAPWSKVRQDVGVYFSNRPVADVLSGPITYLASLPLLLLGVVVLFLMLWLQSVMGVKLQGGGPGGAPTPTHPIVEMLGNADGWMLFQLFFAACVAAPIVEETFFRGVLYRHLREATGSWGFGLSLLSSAIIAGFIFAVVHPQGPIGVPLLMGLAMGFSFGREWRGSLAASIVAHAINNGLVMLLVVNLLAN